MAERTVVQPLSDYKKPPIKVELMQYVRNLERLFNTLAGECKDFNALPTHRDNNNDLTVEHLCGLIDEYGHTGFFLTIKKFGDSQGYERYAEDLIDGFKKSLNLRPDIFKGSAIVLDPSRCLEMFNLDKEVFTAEKPNLRASNVIGDYVKVKNADMGTVSKRWWHKSRFRLANAPDKELSYYCAAKKNPAHKFVAGPPLESEDFKPGDVVYSRFHGTSVFVNRVDKEKQVLHVSQHYNTGHVGYTNYIEKKMNCYTKNRELAYQGDGLGNLIYCNSDVMFAVEWSEMNANAIMAKAGWPFDPKFSIEELNDFLYWRNKLPNLVANIAHFAHNGKTAVIKFYQTEELTDFPEMADFAFQCSPDILGILSQNEVDEIIISKTAKVSDSKLRDTQEQQRRQEAQEKERKKKEEEEKREAEDLKNGPYPQVEALLDKLFLVDAKYCLVTKVDVSLGRVHLKYYEGRQPKEAICRVSRGDLDMLTLVGEKIYSD